MSNGGANVHGFLACLNVVMPIGRRDRTGLANYPKSRPQYANASGEDDMADNSANEAQPHPALQFAFEAHVSVDPAIDLGDIGKGRRRIVPITGGEFSGPDLRGTVLPGGDDVAELEARYVLRTDDGALIHVRNHAFRHGPPEIMAALAAGRAVEPGSYYFRGAAFFETSAVRYAWITRHIIVCTGVREPAGVRLNFYKVL
jgi:Protein of unknown function (DUF3237)